jgi:hypothetical protein
MNKPISRFESFAFQEPETGPLMFVLSGAMVALAVALCGLLVGLHWPS